MKPISKQIRENGTVVIIVHEKMWFGLAVKERIFSASKKYADGYWCWREEPDSLLIPDALSFQLDTWNQVLDDSMPDNVEKFMMFINERIKLASTDGTKTAYIIVKDAFRNIFKVLK